jgi:hypothetical protein
MQVRALQLASRRLLKGSLRVIETIQVSIVEYEIAAKGRQPGPQANREQKILCFPISRTRKPFSVILEKHWICRGVLSNPAGAPTRKRRRL